MPTAQSSLACLLEAIDYLDPQLFALSRDVFSLLSSPTVNSRLGRTGFDKSLGDLRGLAGGLNSWLRALAIDRVALPGMHVAGHSGIDASRLGAGCPAGTLALHPVSPDQLHALSHSATC